MSELKELGQSPGFNVVVALAMLTVVEFLVSAADVPGLLLWLIVAAVAKASLIVTAFMHLMNVFGRES